MRLRSVAVKVDASAPTATHQRKRIVAVRGGLRLADRPELCAAKAFWMAALAPHRPERPLRGPLSLSIVFAWPYRRSEPLRNRRLGPIPHTSRPDLSNLVKTIEDRLVECGYMRDDAEVAQLLSSKRWALEGYVEIRIAEMESPHRRGENG